MGTRLRPGRLLLAAALLCGATQAEANQFDYLDLGQLQGGQLTYGGDPYYSAMPWIWVTSSDGETYDGYDPGEMTFRIDTDYEYTTALGFQEPTRTLRISGAGFAQHEMYLQDGAESYHVDYLPPALEYTPIEMCNQAAPGQGPDAMSTGFVVVGQNAYEVHGFIRYKNEWSQTQTVSDTLHSDVYILCAGDGKPLGGEAPEPPPPPPPPPEPASTNLTPGFLITDASVKIAPAYDHLVTSTCPVTVPIVLEFQGTEPESFAYRVVAASGGASKSLTGQLEEAPGGVYKASREIQILVPEAPPPPPEPVTDSFQSGGGGPPGIQGATDFQGSGGGGGSPVGPAQIQVEIHEGVHAESYRIEIQSPNPLISDYVGYHITCEEPPAEPVVGASDLQMVPDPPVPPPVGQLAVQPGEPPEPGIGTFANPNPTDPPSERTKGGFGRKVAVPTSPSAQLATKPGASTEPSTPSGLAEPGMSQRQAKLAPHAKPTLVFGRLRRTSGQTLALDTAQTKPGAGRGQDLCELSGLQVEWPGDDTPQLRLGGRPVEGARRVPGAVSVMVLPTLDVPAGSTRLEARTREASSTWTLRLNGSCEAVAEAPVRTTPGREAPAADERPPSERTPKGFTTESRERAR